MASLYCGMLVTLLFFMFFNGYPYTLTGKAVNIKDGDTFILLTADQLAVTIRLEGIDAPEKGQDYYKASKIKLGNLLQQKMLSVKVTSKDRYGRLIARIYATGSGDVNLAMVRTGMAWHFKKYSDEVLLADAEIYARTLKVGLWQLQGPTPPWEFRQQKKKSSPKVSSGKQVTQIFFRERPHQPVIVSHQCIGQGPFALL